MVRGEQTPGVEQRLATLLEGLRPTPIVAASLRPQRPRAAHASPWLHVDVAADDPFEYTRGKWHAYLVAGLLRATGVSVGKIIAGQRRFDYSGAVPSRRTPVDSATTADLEASTQRYARLLRTGLVNSSGGTIAGNATIEATLSVPDGAATVGDLHRLTGKLAEHVIGFPWSARAAGMWLLIQDERGSRLGAYGNVLLTCSVMSHWSESLPPGPPVLTF